MPSMHCPICLHELSAAEVRCPNCSARVERDEPDDEREPGEIAWTIIRTVSTDVEANLIAGQLRSFGVPAFVLSQVDSTRGLTVGALAVAKVFVPASMIADAERIMAAPPGDVEEEGGSEPEDLSDVDRPTRVSGDDPADRLGA